jgi:hypothetical protein
MSHHIEREEVDLLREIKRLLERILHLLEPSPVAVSSTLSFVLPQGGVTTMPLTVNLTDVPGVAVYAEFDVNGNPVAATGTVAYSSDTPAVATVDPVSGQLAYIAAGTAVISASDSGNLPASDVLTVNGAVVSTAVSSTLTLIPGAVVSSIRKR